MADNSPQTGGAPVQAGKKNTSNVCIVGAGPAGLACAMVLARAGYPVVVREQRNRVGGRFHGDFQGLENWTSDEDFLHELKHHVSVTAIEAVYVPADDFTDPAVTAISSHLDSMIVLSRSMAAEGMYPAVDPLSSSSILLDPTVVGDEHYRIAEQVRETIAHYKDLQDIISLLGIEELSARDRLIVGRARSLQRFLTQPFAVTEAFTGKPGRSVSLVETVKGCKAILEGACDTWEESSLYMIGAIGEAREKEASSNREANPA